MTYGAAAGKIARAAALSLLVLGTTVGLAAGPALAQPDGQGTTAPGAEQPTEQPPGNGSDPGTGSPTDSVTELLGGLTGGGGGGTPAP
ncbi:MAG: hypothetical protein ACRDRX_24530 [Pseudonocardiaceae bacterium]